MIGQTVSHYKILDKLGEGGMGVVYKAQDLKLDRTVALKFLPHNLTASETEQARLLQEARAASALNHPHICAIHALGEHEGQLFIDMEYVDGKTLREKIEDGGLKIEDGIRYAIQIGEALHEAHTHGIVHRDVKPENIMVGARGEVKVMDFGLAKLKGALKLTRTSSTVGTLAYMAPEQIQGGTSDARADIFSFGVVLYEILTGRLPVRGEHEGAMVYSILNEEPQPIRAYLPEAPSELQHVVSRALAKDPSERYQHVDEMLVDLRGLRSVPQAPGIAPKRVGRRARTGLAIAGAAVVVIALGLLFLPRLFGPPTRTGGSSATDNRKMIVVLPFENLGSPEDDYFANGTTDAITARLASVSGLGVISRQSAIQYRKTTKPVTQIGEELGVDYVLEGTVQREKPGDPSSRVRVIPQLIRVADDTHVWADTYDESMTEVFRVQSDIAESVATRLDVALLEPERRAIEKKPTENLAAYEKYLRGMDYVGVTSITDAELAVDLLKEAVSLDPRFADAWAGLTRAYHDLYWVFDRPGMLTLEMNAARRAQELAPDLPETRIALGYVAYAQRQFLQALEHFERAERQRPSGDGAQAMSRTLRRLGRWQEALNYAEKARRLIPRSYTIYSDELGYTRMCLRLFEEAEQDFDQAILLSRDLNDAYLLKAQAVAARSGDVSEARRVMLEMSRRMNVARATEATVIQGTAGQLTVVALRLFPDACADLLDAFEAGPMERYRALQPAAIATTHLARAIIHETVGDRQSAMARYDSARVYYEATIRSNPQSAYICTYHSKLGLAYAGLGRCNEAIREGKQAVRMIPISDDAVVGPDGVFDLAQICVRCGRYEAAIDQIEKLLAVPFYISPGLLRVDPIWEPIRSNPRFRRLAEGQ